MELKEIDLAFCVTRPVLAVGSSTKNTLCFAQGKSAYLSPIHADLNKPKDFLAFANDIRHFLRKDPKIIAYDLHPEYQSTKFALSLSPATYHLQPIQHHHGHIASCMAENGMKNNKVIGVAFDGTGLGSDGKIWGAEFLLCDYKGFQRKAHLREIPLLGGERAVLEPWRLASVWLYLLYKDRFFGLGINFVKKIDKKRWAVLKKMYVSGFNCPPASSMGRLFDAVASLVLERTEADSEAELPVALERQASRFKSKASAYDFAFIREKDGFALDPLPMFRQITADLKKGFPKGKIALQFHLTVAEMILKTCLIIRKETGINKVVVSGGVFQNKLLLSLSLGLLYREKFQVATHKNLPCSDSGISLGQAVVANFRKE